MKQYGILYMGSKSKICRDLIKVFPRADAQENPVFISEYNVSDKRFTPVFKIKKAETLSGKGYGKVKNEWVYVNRAGKVQMFNQRRGA